MSLVITLKECQNDAEGKRRRAKPWTAILYGMRAVFGITLLAARLTWESTFFHPALCVKSFDSTQENSPIVLSPCLIHLLRANGCDLTFWLKHFGPRTDGAPHGTSILQEIAKANSLYTCRILISMARPPLKQVPILPLIESF